jgi:hypothetical protein
MSMRHVSLHDTIDTFAYARTHSTTRAHATVQQYSIHRVQAYAEYSMHRAWYTPRTESSEDRMSTAPCQSLIFWQTMRYSILYILTITICPMNRILAPVTLPGRTTASTLTSSQCSMNFAQPWPPMCISIFA